MIWCKIPELDDMLPHTIAKKQLLEHNLFEVTDEILFLVREHKNKLFGMFCMVE